MKIKNFFNWMCVLAVGFSAVACSDDDDAPVVDSEVSKVALPRHRMFILNEGKKDYNNAGIGFYAPDNNMESIDDIFYLQNDMRLGDTAQDMIEEDGKIYVAVYGSNYLARLNGACVEEARISFAGDTELGGGIRYIAAEDGYVYASFYGSMVAKINAQTMQVEAKLRTPGANLEGVAIVGDNLYVSNAYTMTSEDGKTKYIYHNDVFVIDLKTFTLKETLSVVENPNDMTEEDDKVFVISNGNYKNVGYSFQMIDPANNNIVTDLAVASKMCAGNDKVYLVYSYTDWSTYITTNTFFSYDIKTGRVINESFLKNAPAELSSSSIYMMAVDDENGDIYIGVSDYSRNGDMYRFRKDGTFVEKFDCGGLNPRTAVFVD